MKYFIFILALCVQPNKSIKVLTTPKFPKDKAPAASFATLKNPTSPVLTTLSSCLWTSLYAEDFGSAWSFGNNFFRTSFRSEGKIFAIGEYTVILIEYHQHRQEVVIFLIVQYFHIFIIYIIHYFFDMKVACPNTDTTSLELYLYIFCQDCGPLFSAPV